MLYLISGASRSGKTILAERLFRELEIPYLSLDWIMMGFTNGIPEYGIHDKLWPDEIAERLWAFLEAMCESMLASGAEVVIEGEAILPRHVRLLADRHAGSIRACFLGFAETTVREKVDLVRRHHDGRSDWLLRESDDFVLDHIGNMITYSRGLRVACEEYLLPYFDTSTGFAEALDAARIWLVSESSI